MVVVVDSTMQFSRRLSGDTLSIVRRWPKPLVRGQMILGVVELRWFVRPVGGLKENRIEAAIHEIHDALRLQVVGCTS